MNEATSPRALSRKATELTELEGNERRVKETRAKERKAKPSEKKERRASDKGKASEEDQTEKVNERWLFGRPPVKKLCDLCEATDHWACACPHGWSIRPGAVLGPRALILCVCCGEGDPQLTHDGEPGVDFPARAITRPKSYPTIEEKRRAMKVASDNAARASSKGPELDPKLIAAAAAGAAAAAADIASDDDDYSTGKPKPWGYDLY